ncbi:hypothetical protein D3C72_2024310 [compost metagenome]
MREDGVVAAQGALRLQQVADADQGQRTGQHGQPVMVIVKQGQDKDGCRRNEGQVAKWY